MKLQCTASEDFQISIDGTNIERLNMAHLRNIVGIVSQEPLLFADTVSVLSH